MNIVSQHDPTQVDIRIAQVFAPEHAFIVKCAGTVQQATPINRIRYVVYAVVLLKTVVDKKLRINVLRYDLLEQQFKHNVPGRDTGSHDFGNYKVTLRDVGSGVAGVVNALAR